tara:strand:- start:530 stop:1195 length:666 start_codon:yes stop_codon:yes gene_type:complete
MPFEKENITMKITKSRLREIILEELQAETGIQENGGDDIFADNHYCIHHGGVEHNGRIEMAEAIQHVVPDDNGYISHYDMKLIKSGIVLEDVAAEDIQVTNASLAYNDVTEAKHGNRDGDDGDAHGAMKPKKKDDKEGKRTPLSQKAQQDRRKRARKGLEEGEDELEELARATAGSDHRDRMEKRKEDARKRKEKEAKKDQQSEGLEDLKALIAQELKNLL